MAITTAQKIILFEILETPYLGKIDQPLGDFNLSSIEHQPVNDAQKLQFRINDRLAAFTTDEENYMVQLLNEWAMIGSNIAAVNGSIGGVNGATYDPLLARQTIQRRMRNFIGVASMIEEIKVGHEQSEGGLSVCGMR